MSILQRLPRLTVMEWVATAIIVGILAAMIMSQGQWASSGTLRLPIRVFVFDAVRRQPIPNAMVRVIRCPPISVPNGLTDVDDRFASAFSNEFPHHWALSNPDGVATVEHDFTTGASHVRPVPRAHVDFAWVLVKAQGFGGAALPVRHESQPTSILRKQGELVVPVGLISDKAVK